jgi:FAD/FMN-containing dehydrogenase
VKKDELLEIVDRGNVLDDPATLDSYSRDQSFTLPLKPWFVVYPENVEQVQRLVRYANQTQTPLIPISSGQPHFNGDTIPSVPGAVIVDLRKMNRILRIDRKNRMTVIEPGVTYGQLQPELAKEGLRIATPLLPRANKSVIASLLERQPTLVPKYQWSLPEPLRCLEIVWGNSEILWTGEAGVQPHSLEKQWEAGWAQINAMGPQETDWHRLVSGAQGTMGIVTWASIKCEILPKVHRLFFIPADNLNELTDCAYQLLRVRLGDELLLLNSSDLAYCIGDNDDTVKTLKEKLPSWVLLIGVAGRDILPEERVRVQEQDIVDIAQQFGLHTASAIAGVPSVQVLEILLSSSKEPCWKLRYKGGCQSIFFLTTLDRTSKFIETVYTLAESLRYPTNDIGVYLQPQHQGVTCHCEFDLPFDLGNQIEVARTKELFNHASDELIKKGAYFSRPYGIWSNLVYNRDTQSKILLQKVKVIFDPNAILNPGKLCF